MTTIPTTTTPPSTTAPATSGSAGGVITDQSSLNETYSQFLTLLTTQLQHQDPTSPMDTAQFTSQLVSFSQVEQQLKSNADLDKLVASSNNNQASLGLSYIGRNVSVQGSTFNFDPSKDAAVTLGYNLSSAAATNKISILDSNGNTVYSTSGLLTPGENSMTWNGTEMDGSAAPAGAYTVQVSALDATQTAVSATTNVPGTVTGMQTASDGTIELQIGSQLVPLANVTSVYN